MTPKLQGNKYARSNIRRPGFMGDKKALINKAEKKIEIIKIIEDKNKKNNKNKKNKNKKTVPCRCFFFTFCPIVDCGIATVAKARG